MTIVVGVIAKDGIVIATDSMGSNPSNGMGTNNKKSYCIGKRFLVGIAGGDNAGKLLIDNIQQLSSLELSHYDFSIKLQEQTQDKLKQINPALGNVIAELQAYYANIKIQNQLQHIPNNLVNLPPMLYDCSALIGYYFQDEYSIINCQNLYLIPTIIKQTDLLNQKTPKFYTMLGSGALIAEQIAPLMIDMLMINGLPTLKQARLFAYWLLKYTTKNACQFVGEPLSMVQLFHHEKVIESGEHNIEELDGLFDDFMNSIKSYHENI